MTSAVGKQPAGVAFSFDGLKRRALSLGAAKAFDYAMQFLLPVVLVRCLDTAAFGEYRLLWLAVGTIMVVATMGMVGSLYVFLPRSEPRLKRIYIAQTTAFLGVTGLLSAWAVSPWNPWLPQTLAPLAKYGALVPAFVVLWVTTYILEMLPTIDERVGTQARITVGLSVLRVVVLAAGAYATGDMATLLWLLVGLVVIRLGVLLAYVARHHGLAPPWFDRALFKNQFCHAAPFGLANSLFSLRSQADQWIAAWMFALTSFAAFSIAAVLAPLVNLFRTSVNEAFLPSMSRMQAAGDLRGMLALNSRANVLVGTLLYPMLAFAFVFADDIVTLVYTAAYLEAAPVMRVYALGLACMVIEIGSIVLLLREGPFALKVNLVALAGSILLSVLAAKQFGLLGAAVGSVSVLYADRVAVLSRVAMRSGLRFGEVQDWRGLGTALFWSAVGALMAWLAVRLAFEGGPLAVRLIVGGVVLFGIYLIPMAKRLKG